MELSCNECSKIYHDNFYIPSLNLVIEIKSSYILKLDKEIKEKKKYNIFKKLYL